MLVEDISDPFFSSIARIIEENLYNLGYKIFHYTTNNNTERAKALLQIFRERQVDGYIIAPAPGLEKEIQALLNDAKPVILFDRYFPGLNTTNVVIDNMGGAFTAVQHLVENGYINIALITLNSEQVQMLDRLKGYDKAISKNKLPRNILRIEYRTAPVKIIALVKQFLEKNPAIDAIVFATNYLAVSGLHAIRELKLDIPKDIGVVGFDDNTHFSLFSPSITAVAQPVEDISKATVEQLVVALTKEDKGKKRKTIVLPTALIVRESSLSGIRVRKLKYK
jgi:LacI family transcriptional regulator